MAEIVSKSRFKARALDFFRQVEQTWSELIITDRGRPVLRLLPYRTDPQAQLKELRGTVARFDDPTEPVAADEWEALR